MADIEIAVKAKNEASSAINAVSKDLQGLAQSAATTSQAFVSVGAIGQSFQGASAQIRQISAGLQQATQEAAGYNRTLSEAATIKNAGGAEALGAGIKAVRAELAATIKEADKLASAGKLNFGEGTDANLAKIRSAVGQTRAELNNLSSVSKAAAKQGVLGDGAAASAQLAKIGSATKSITDGLKSVSSQAKQTEQALASVGKGTGLSSIKDDIRQIDSAFGGLSSLLSGGLGAFAGGLGLGAAAAAIGGIGAAINDAVQEADRFGKLNDSFQQLAASANQSGDAILSALRGASDGMISDADLVLSANKAMMLGVADSAEEMSALLEIARTRGAAMGLDVSQAFNDIVTGLGRESPLILDNLGITINAAAAMETYASSLGKAADQLSSAERKQALLNAVMEQSKGMTAGGGGSGAGVAAAQAQAAEANAKVVVGQFFAPLVRNIEQGKVDVINMLQGTYKEVDANLRDLNDLIADRKGVNSSGNAFTIDDAQLGVFQQLSQATTEANNAFAAGVPNVEDYRNALNGYVAEAKSSGTISTQTANLIKLAADGLKAEVAAFNEAQAAAAALDGKLDNLREKQANAALAAERAAVATVQFNAALKEAQSAASGVASSVAAAANAVNAMRAQLVQATIAGLDAAEAMRLMKGAQGVGEAGQQIAQGLGNLGFVEPKDIQFYVDLNTAEAVKKQQELLDGFNQGQSAIKGLDSLVPQLIKPLGGEKEALAWVESQKAAMQGIIDQGKLFGTSQDEVNAHLARFTNLAQNSVQNITAQSQVVDQAIGRIGDISGDLVDNMGLDKALAWSAEQQTALRVQAEQMRGMRDESGQRLYTEEAIAAQINSQIDATAEWAGKLDGVSEAAKKIKATFDDIKSKVSSVIDESQKLPSFKAHQLYTPEELKKYGLTGDAQVSVDQAVNNSSSRPDAINENARRLMALSVEGIKDQPWLEEFKKEVPEIFKELSESPDIRGTGLRILQEFEAGMRPELLDKGMIKDRVKQMILGENNAAALAQEIAQEIATEMGISLQQAMGATNAALGIGTGEGAAGATNAAAPDMTPQGQAAGVTLRAGMVAGFDATGMTVEILAKIDAEFSSPKSWLAINKSGAAVGNVWGGGFLSGAAGTIPPGLYDILLGGLMPLIVAALAGNGSRTGAQP